MALVNKNGQTPTQVRQEDDLRQQLEKVLKQQEQLQKQLDTLRQKVAYTADKTDTVESIVDTGFYYTKKKCGNRSGICGIICVWWSLS